MGPHDKAFRKLMREDGVAEALLRERLPASLVARFAGPPRHLSESFVDGSGRGHVADVVLSVELTGGESAVVLFVVEHKRTEGAFVLVQVLRYLTSLYEQLARAPGTGRLPVVVPLIIYNGDAPWVGPRRFSDLLEASVEVKRLSVDFEVVLLDVGAEPARALSAHPTLKGGLLGLKAAATPLTGLGPVLGQMVGALADEESTLRFFLQYLMTVVGRDALPLVERAAQQQGQGKEKAMQTISEFLESKGYRRGKRQGLNQYVGDVLEKMWSEPAYFPGDRDAQLLSCYDHGGQLWSLSGAGMQCRWDTSNKAGVWVPDEYLRKQLDDDEAAGFLS